MRRIGKDKAVYKELDDSLVRAATTTSSLEAEQDSGNIISTRSKATPNEVGSQGTTSGGDPKRQETIGDTIAQTRFENVSKLSNDPLLARGEDNAIDADEDITLVNDQDDAYMFDVNNLIGDEVLAEPEVVVKDVSLTVDEITLAQALAALKSVKLKVKANVVEEPSIPVSASRTKVSAATTTTTATISTPRKGIIITELELSKFDFRTDLVEGSSKRARTELKQESIKKQKVDDDKETIELQSLIKVIPDEEEVAIDVVPLATKPPTNVDWKIHKK
ncbi:hypothetical protein Tco_1054184 [Tanacetum coccineum]|uniref:Uncharacterized protein n=1 Tax=Tanacetum coccineum TaxID=301880 RepID=A0ABQ5GXX3_9ASTR